MTNYPTYDMKTKRWSHDLVHEVPRRDDGKYVPVVAISDDTPAEISKNQAFRLGHDRRCATCGGPMGDLVWFPKVPASKFTGRFGPNGRRHIHFMEKVTIKGEENPPMHLECATLTLSGGCPFMSAQTPKIVFGARDYEVVDDRANDNVTFNATIVEARKIKRNQQPATEK